MGRGSARDGAGGGGLDRCSLSHLCPPPGLAGLAAQEQQQQLQQQQRGAMGNLCSTGIDGTLDSAPAKKKAGDAPDK